MADFFSSSCLRGAKKLLSNFMVQVWRPVRPRKIQEYKQNILDRCNIKEWLSAFVGVLGISATNNGKKRSPYLWFADTLVSHKIITCYFCHFFVASTDNNPLQNVKILLYHQKVIKRRKAGIKKMLKTYLAWKRWLGRWLQTSSLARVN